MIAVAIAPYDDQPGEDHRRPHTAKPKAPKASDSVHPRTCLRCGLLVPPIFWPHCSALDCIDGLRSELAMQGWTGPKNGGRPKRKAAATG